MQETNPSQPPEWVASLNRVLIENIPHALYSNEGNSFAAIGYSNTTPPEYVYIGTVLEKGHEDLSHIFDIAVSHLSETQGWFPEIRVFSRPIGGEDRRFTP